MDLAASVGGTQPEGDGTSSSLDGMTEVRILDRAGNDLIDVSGPNANAFVGGDIIIGGNGDGVPPGGNADDILLGWDDDFLLGGIDYDRPAAGDQE
jgi:hypothetical protein